jgi:hypothetical protein
LDYITDGKLLTEGLWAQNGICSTELVTAFQKNLTHYLSESRKPFKKWCSGPKKACMVEKEKYFSVTPGRTHTLLPPQAAKPIKSNT